MNRTLELKALFKRIHDGDDLFQVTAESKDFLAAVEPKDIILAERAMMESGYSAADLRRVYPAVIEILRERAQKLKTTLPANHILRKILSEHELLICFLADLEDVNQDIQRMDTLSAASTEFRKLAQLTRIAFGAMDHLRLEDELIFPELQNRGYIGAPQILSTEHISMEICASKLKEMIDSVRGLKVGKLQEFKDTLNEVVTSAISICRAHILCEDGMVYPIAMELIDDQRVWKRIRALSEEIGYCSMQNRW